MVVREDFYSEAGRLLKKLSDGEVVVVAKGKEGKVNGMTIAWGFIGNMWNQPFFISAVRPQRFTWNLIKESGFFTVNFLPKGLQNALSYFGSVSGYNEDKFENHILNFETDSSGAFCRILEAETILDCAVVTANQIEPFALPADYRDKNYRQDNGYHTMIYGKIVNLIKR